jgi:hypothetical protein
LRHGESRYTGGTTKYPGGRILKKLIAIILASAAVLAHAHQGDSEIPQAGYDCEHPPEDAVAELPGILGTAGRMICLPAGPSIHADLSWLWHYTGSFFDLPSIPGYAHVDSASMLPPFYFTDISMREVRGEEAARRSEELAEAVETYRPGAPLQYMQIIDATNNYGRSISINVAMETENNGWLVVCTPQCQPNYVIVIKKRKSN